MSLYLMFLMFPKLVSLSFHVSVFDVPFNPCPHISCVLTNLMSLKLVSLFSMSLYLMFLMYLKLMSLSIHVPAFDVPEDPQIHVPFYPHPLFLYSLTHSMALKLISLSIQFLLFKVVHLLQVPHIYVLSKFQILVYTFLYEKYLTHLFLSKRYLVM